MFLVNPCSIPCNESSNSVISACTGRDALGVETEGTEMTTEHEYLDLEHAECRAKLIRVRDRAYCPDCGNNNDYERLRRLRATLMPYPVEPEMKKLIDRLARERGIG
jgi:hypothetical protein